MKILITGASGFVGSHLVEYCQSKGAEVHGTIRWRSDTKNLKDIDLCLHECDLNDASAVREVINKVRPDWIFHLAAQSFVKASWTNPGQTLSNNIIGEVNLLEAVRSIKNYKPRIMIAGSSEEYGHTDEVLTEEHRLLPLSPYGVSKVAQDLLARQYIESYNMDIVITRAFNHTGPRRGEVFVCSSFAKQIADIEKGKTPIIHVGNLSSERDFTDVRDMVRAYYLALAKCLPGTYNICSGTTYPIGNILKKLLSFTKSNIIVQRDSARMRPSDLKVLAGDCSKFKKATGWEPVIPIDVTLKDLLDYWRQ